MTTGSRGPVRMSCSGTSKTASRPPSRASCHNHLPGTNHFARFGADRGDRTWGIGGENRIAQPILRDAHLCPSSVDLGLGRSQALFGFVESGAGRPATLQELLLPVKGEVRLLQRSLSRREFRLRRTQLVLLVLGIEPSDDVAALEHIAHVDGPLDHASVNAKGEADFVLGTNLPCQGNGLALCAAPNGDRPDGPRLGGWWRRLVTARDWSRPSRSR